MKTDRIAGITTESTENYEFIFLWDLCALCGEFFIL